MSLFMRYALSLFKDLWIWSCFRGKSDSLLVTYAFCIKAISTIYLNLIIDDLSTSKLMHETASTSWHFRFLYLYLHQKTRIINIL